MSLASIWNRADTLVQKQGKHSLMFNLTSNNSLMGTAHFQTLWWETLAGGGEEQRLRVGVEGPEIQDLG